MTDDVPAPLAAIRLNLYRTLRGTSAARDDPAMACLSLEAGILEAIRDLDAILTPEPDKGATRKPSGARRGPGACREARARKAARTAQDAS